MKHVLFPLLLILFISKSQAQQFSDTFTPVLGGIPGISIAQHTDGNYLLYGFVDYYQSEPSGSLLKVDSKGNRVVAFKLVHTDVPIAQVVILPSGKILLYGPFHYLNGEDVGQVAMLNTDGSPDNNFHADPALKISIVAAQSTGKILAVSDSKKLIRLNTDGSTDGTFSAITLPDPISGITVAPDDAYFVTVNATSINRYDADGQADMTFSADGVSPIGPLVLQPDGKPVFLSGKYLTTPPYTGTYTVTRLLTSGAKDPSFTTASVSNTVGDGDKSPLLTKVLIRKNGKIALSGRFANFGSQTGNIIELNTDGSASRTLLALSFLTALNMIEDAQENIFATGFIYLPTEPGLKHILKIKPNLLLDPSFSPPVAGVAYSGFKYSLQGQPSGKVLLGDLFYAESLKNMPGPLVRLLPTGKLDSSFPILANVDSKEQAVSALLVQDDGKVVVSGNYLFFSTPSPTIGRLKADGGLDNSFQTGTGFTESGYGSSPSCIRSKNNLLYVAGFFDTYNGQTCQSFVVLNADGSLPVTPKSEVPASGYVLDLEVQSSGKALLLGNFPLPGGEQRKVIRLNPDGTLDPTFDLVVNGTPRDIEVDTHDNIWLAGSGFGNGMLLRFLPDGQPDNLLNQGAGFAKTPGYASSDECIGYFVKSIENDRFVVGGSFMSYDGHPVSGVVMMDSNGGFTPIEGSKLDPISVAYAGWYINQTLYIFGRLSKNRGQNIEAFTTVVPLDILGAEHSASIDAEVYPNPATQGIFIKLSERERNATATFHSSQGEYLMTVPLSNGTVNEVELRSLKPGVFILSISTASGSRRFKLVKA